MDKPIEQIAIEAQLWQLRMKFERTWRAVGIYPNQLNARRVAGNLTGIFENGQNNLNVILRQHWHTCWLYSDYKSLELMGD